MFFRMRTMFLAQFLLIGFIGFGVSGALSASEGEVLEASKIFVYQMEVDRVLSVPVAEPVVFLDQDDFFDFDSKTVVKTKFYRKNSIRKKISSSQAQGNIVINFQTSHLQDFDLKSKNPFLSLLIVFQSISTQMPILKTTSVLSLKDFEKLKVDHVSILDRNRETVISYMIKNLLTLSLFQNSFCSELSLALWGVFPFQQIESMKNLTKKMLNRIGRFAQNRKEFSVRSTFPNFAGVPAQVSSNVSFRLKELTFLYEKEETANRQYPPLFSFVTNAIRLLPFVKDVGRNFGLLALRVPIYTSLKAIEIDGNHRFPKKESIYFVWNFLENENGFFLKTPTNGKWSELKKRTNLFSRFSV
ncbi:hypothetical protein [Leptospira santarosai]|uniref:hypothetical protein n=1 Tax=Leptospira santarosai TaxID=28183 RepID=UPI0024AEDDBE|nr:hypothetical protein [Leptospira santarosai]MDI7189010.1 hypothetical protein [Leptospira santarosai]MDI7214323.1 hypothetical protein [Leptospira santarosai]MDI7221387.1 hypothetical protein [Leptospira santarosai]